ncbi:hypothetical protein ABIC20_002386 [Methylobacterium radiotolerans]|uniref:Uncharacterized protein n=1 Tax=Methylobacterium radiotolerans TaxID=31998 RepID=A0ABV2NF11_9HYPH
MLSPSTPAVTPVGDRLLQGREGLRVLGAQVDVAAGGAGGDARDGHALDEVEGIALHHHPVGEGAGIALVGVADHVFLVRLGEHHGVPLDAGGEAGTAPAAQAGLAHRRDNALGIELQGGLEAAVAAMGPVIVHGDRVDHAAAVEGQALLPGEVGDFFRIAEAQGVVAARGQAGIQQGVDVGERHGSVGDPPLGRADFDHRLQPEQAAGAGADDGDVEAAALGAREQGAGDLVGAEAEGDGVARNVEGHAHWRTSVRAASRASAVRCATGSPSTSAAGPLAQRPRQ